MAETAFQGGVELLWLQQPWVPRPSWLGGGESGYWAVDGNGTPVTVAGQWRVWTVNIPLVYAPSRLFAIPLFCLLPDVLRTTWLVLVGCPCQLSYKPQDPTWVPSLSRP